MGICGSHFLHTTFARFKRNAGKLSRSETATLRPWCRKSIYQTLPEILRCALIRLIVRFFYSRCSFFYRYFLFFCFFDSSTDSHPIGFVLGGSVRSEHRQPDRLPEGGRSRMEYSHRPGHLLDAQHCKRFPEGGRSDRWRFRGCSERRQKGSFILSSNAWLAPS